MRPRLVITGLIISALTYGGSWGYDYRAAITSFPRNYVNIPIYLYTMNNTPVLFVVAQPLCSRHSVGIRRENDY